MTRVAKPPKSEQVEADVSQEPAVSEQMWQVQVWAGMMWIDFGWPLRSVLAAEVVEAAQWARGRETRIIPVDPGQLEEKR